MPAGFQLLATVDSAGEVAHAGGRLPDRPDLHDISLPLPPLVPDLSASAFMPSASMISLTCLSQQTYAVGSHMNMKCFDRLIVARHMAENGLEVVVSYPGMLDVWGSLQE